MREGTCSGSVELMFPADGDVQKLTSEAKKQRRMLMELCELDM